MAMSGGRDDGEPMMEINTTPLIDVMLVLLIMFIITIPAQTHAVKVDLPVNTPNQTPPPIDPQKNKVVIMPDGTVTWNGSPVDEDTIKHYVRDHLARYKVPREVVFLEELPRNPTGKILKRELREMGLD